MRTFSQRMGLASIRSSIQTNDLDRPTRNALWNIIGSFFNNSAGACTVYKDIWIELYQETYDTHPRAISDPNVSEYKQFYSFYKSCVLDAPFNECMDLIEFMNQKAFRDKWERQMHFPPFGCKVPVASEYNTVFQQFMVGYRIINGQILKITNDEETAAIEKAARKSPDSVAEQISKAIRSLADRRNPDFATSIKCSISAVEAQCRILLNDPTPTLGKALNQLKAKGIPLHGALKEGFKILYGFTSDANGIRHAGIAPSDADADLAKFMLVACSAFVNYLRSKG